jgi:hypothetical protein
VLFLDIDGVLNSSEFLTHQFSNSINYPESTKEDFALQQLDEVAIRRLNLLFRIYPDLKIVISSTWRKLYPLHTIQELLESKGLQKNIIIDKTKGHLSVGIRGYEIKEWLDAHPEVSRFVILDDDVDMDFLSSYLVQTDFRKGLMEEDVDKICKLFREQEHGIWIGDELVK